MVEPVPLFDRAVSAALDTLAARPPSADARIGAPRQCAHPRRGATTRTARTASARPDPRRGGVLAHIVALTAPLFLLIFVGYSLARFGAGRRPLRRADAIRLFRRRAGAAVPADERLLPLPPVDARLLIAYFGGCVVVFVGARVVAARAFGLGGVDQSIFGVGTIFSNNVLLGVPLAQVTLGAPAMPTVSLIVVFNALLLWTLVTVSVEWARHGEVSVAGSPRRQQVALNPVIAGILIGTAWGFTGLALPRFADDTLSLVARPPCRCR